VTFEILGQIGAVDPIARGASIREVARLRRIYGAGRWRKLKGVATVRRVRFRVIRRVRRPGRGDAGWRPAPGAGILRSEVRGDGR
jgi:hypothetical protein